MKKFLCILILSFGCSETTPAVTSDASLDDTGTSKDVSVDVSKKQDVSNDVASDVAAKDVSKDLSVDATEDVTPDMATRIPRGTCESDLECPDACVTIGDEITGWKTCAKRYTERTQCDEPGQDQCCKSEDCKTGANGVCLSPLPQCSGVRPPTHNRCYYDECADDGDCTANELGLCIPGGAFGEGASNCSYGGCRVDTDCTQGEEGECIPFTEPCVGRHAGFHCVYKDSECRSDEDCKKGRLQYCSPKDGGTCEEFRPPA